MNSCFDFWFWIAIWNATVKLESNWALHFAVTSQFVIQIRRANELTCSTDVHRRNTAWSNVCVIPSIFGAWRPWEVKYRSLIPVYLVSDIHENPMRNSITSFERPHMEFRHLFRKLRRTELALTEEHSWRFLEFASCLRGSWLLLQAGNFTAHKQIFLWFWMVVC